MTIQIFDVLVPIKTISEANSTEHWSKKNKRHQTQKKWIFAAFRTYSAIIPKKCHIVLTRIAPRKLDSDNLVSSFKYVRDAIADHINPGYAPGFADSGDNMTWEYKQEKGEPRIHAIRIQIFNNKVTIPNCS